MHVDPLSVVDIGCANITTLFFLPPCSLLYLPSPPYPSCDAPPYPSCDAPPPPLTLPPPLFLSYSQLSLCVTYYHSFRPPSSPISLQNYGTTAFLCASGSGNTEAMKLLLTFPDVDVNHANVRLYLLTPFPVVVGGGVRVIYLTLSLTHSDPRNDDLPSPNAQYAPQPNPMTIIHSVCVCCLW